MFNYRSKSVLLLSVLLLVLVSGCTSSDKKGASSSAVVIEAFEPDIKGIPINPGEELQFSLIVRNTGSEDAKDITINIAGMEGWDSGTWTGGCAPTNSISGNIVTGLIPKLAPPNPEFGTPGESRQCILKTKAPAALRLDQTFQPKVSIRYTYDSITVGRITIPSREKVVIRQDSGQALDAETTFKSASPIDIDLSTRGQGGQVRISGSTDVKFPLFITVSNLGGGFVCKSPSSCSDTLKKVPLQVEPKSQLLTVQSCISDNEIDLFRGQRGEIKCDLTAKKSADRLVDDLVSVEVKSTGYGYTIEQPGPVITVKRSAAS